MSRAIQLEPRNPLYRNNFAAVLVDQGRVGEAFEQLRSVHGAAGAYYNVGYLLNKKGQTQEALQYFALALQADPSLAPARRVVRLSATTDRSGTLAEARGCGRDGRQPRGRCAGGAALVTQEPLRVSQASAPMPPDTPLPQRLPPTNARQTAAVMDGSDSPGTSHSCDHNVAPLPLVSPAAGDDGTSVRH